MPSSRVLSICLFAPQSYIQAVLNRTAFIVPSAPVLKRATCSGPVAARSYFSIRNYFLIFFTTNSREPTTMYSDLCLQTILQASSFSDAIEQSLSVVRLICHIS
jgi:hypothetical protein